MGIKNTLRNIIRNNEYLRELGYSIEGFIASSLHRFDMFRGIAIETTSLCNRRCSYCPNCDEELRNLRPQKHMDMELFKEIISQLKEIGYKGKINLQHYGEPLLDSLLEERISYTKKQLPKAKIEFATNGDLLTPEKLDSLIAAGVNYIFVTDHDYDTSHGKLNPGKETVANKAISELEQYLKEHPEKKNYVGIRHGIAEKSNRGGLVEIVRGQLQHKLQCSSDMHYLYITVEGDAVPCCNAYLEKESAFGNVKEQGIIDVWNSYNDFRRAVRKGQYALPMCKYCAGIETPIPIEQRIREYANENTSAKHECKTAKI